VEGPLSQLHAELDAENGGRFEDARARGVMLSGTYVNSLDEYWQFNPDIPTVFPSASTTKRPVSPSSAWRIPCWSKT
jgi:hypothetical protein